MRTKFSGATNAGPKKAGNFFRGPNFLGLNFYNRLLITLAVVTSASLFADSTPLEDKKTGSNIQNTNTRAWKNATFAEVQQLEKPRIDWDIKDNLVPKSWFLSTTKFDDTPKLEMVKVEGSNDYFVKLRDYATIYQYFEGAAEKLKMAFKTSGKGKLDIFAFREIKEDGKTKVLPIDKIATLDIDSTDWQSQKLEYVKKDKNERIALAFRVDPPGVVCIDDVFVAPAE